MAGHLLEDADACAVDSPGRFFAANTLKALLAYLLVHYDVKLAGDGSRPANVLYSSVVLPNPAGRLMFRKREVAAA